MKKFTLLIFSLLVVSYTYADRVTSAKAQQNVLAFLNKGTASQRRVASKVKNYEMVHESDGYYAFANGTGNGYIIAASDDEMVSPVLGYSDSGTFDIDNMPANMKAWLEQYDKEAQWLAAHPGMTQAVSKVERADISPLVTAKWDQSPIYNDLCPLVGKKKCVTGCVATATAQVMYYHKWPETGRGSYSYKWKKKTLSTDFSQSTYKWDIMTDTYDSNSPIESQGAVALLMSDVGIAENMNYGVEESEANSDSIPYALSHFFRYSRLAHYVTRSYYTTDEWEQMAYESLQRKEPICYDGAGSGGHEFVVDGYTNGYFHINWGWGGSKSDGYYVLSSLNPQKQGTGGSVNPYNGIQGMVLDIRPDMDDSTLPIAYMVNDKEFALSYDAKEKNYLLMGRFTDEYQHDTISVRQGLEFVDSEGKSQFYFDEDTLLYEYQHSRDTVYVDKSIFPKQDGKYKVYPAYYDINNKTENRMHSYTYLNGYCYVTIKDSAITISLPQKYDAKLKVSNVKHSQFYQGKFSPASATFTNVGTEHYVGDVCFAIRDTVPGDYRTFDFADLQPGESKTVSIMLQAPKDLTIEQSFMVLDAAGDTLLLEKNVDIKEVPEDEFFEGRLTAVPNTTINNNELTVTANVECTDGFAEDFNVYVYDDKGNSIDSLEVGYPMGEGETGELTFSGAISKLSPYTTYKYNITAWNNQFTYLMYDETQYFYFTTSDITGIQSVENTTDSEPVIYNLQGQRVLNPVKGQIYIIGRKKVIR